jgi:hypothetical protein
MTPTTPSVSLMLILGQLIQGHVIERNTAIVAPDSDEAWAQLLTTGECAMVADAEQLQKIRATFAGWVFEGASI